MKTRPSVPHSPVCVFYATALNAQTKRPQTENSKPNQPELRILHPLKLEHRLITRSFPFKEGAGD